MEEFAPQDPLGILSPPAATETRAEERQQPAPREEEARASAPGLNEKAPEPQKSAPGLEGSKAGGVPDDYFARIRAAESGGNDAAKNPLSSATGRYQFTKGTWNGLMRNHPELGLTPDGRLDPAQQERAIKTFTQNNADVLMKNGVSITGGSLYGAHFLGAGGAAKVFNADPSLPMSSVVGADVVNANPFLSKMSVADFKNWAERKGGRGPVSVASSRADHLASSAPLAKSQGRGAGEQPTSAPEKASNSDTALGLLAQMAQSGAKAPGLSAPSSRGPQSSSPNAIQNADTGEASSDIADIDRQIASLQPIAHSDPKAAALLSSLHARRTSLQLAS